MYVIKAFVAANLLLLVTCEKAVSTTQLSKTDTFPLNHLFSLTAIKSFVIQNVFVIFGVDCLFKLGDPVLLEHSCRLHF